MTDALGFIILADNTQSSLAGIDNNDLEAMYEALGIVSNGGFARHVVSEKIYTSIAQSLTTFIEGTHGLSHNDLIKELVYNSVLQDRDYSDYIAIVEIINDACVKIPQGGTDINWSYAIKYAKAHIAINGVPYNFGSLRNRYPQEYDTAFAAKKLKEKGCEVSIKRGSLKILRLETIFQEVEKSIQDIGGTTVIANLFSYLDQNKWFNEELGRYVIVQQFNIDPSQSEPVRPFGYILNLAVKNIATTPPQPPTLKMVTAALDHIFNTSSLLLSVFEIQRYHQLGFAFIDNGNIAKSLRDIALFDSAFTFKQGEPKIEILYLSELFNWVEEDKFTSQYHFTVKEFVLVSRAIILQFDKTRGPVTIYLSGICKQLKHKIDKNKIFEILKHLSHKPEEINSDFISFEDQDKVNFNLLPLIKTGDTKYLLCDMRWNCPSFYECLLKLVRDLFPTETDRIIGVRLEELVYSEVSKKNIVYGNGKYKIGKVEEECDMIIEGEDTIVIFEIKKKILTAKSRSGVDSQVLIDLTGSFLKSQYQIGKAELQLREKGYIELRDSANVVKKIELKDRKIERVSLSHMDYFSFQDRILIKQFLTLLLNTRFHLLSDQDSELNKKFSEINEIAELLLKQSLRLEKYDPNFKDHPYFNCWFLSLPQLFLILKHSIDEKSFVEILKKTKHITFGSGNFYNEFYFANLRKQS
jgi:hypothetical protein